MQIEKWTVETREAYVGGLLDGMYVPVNGVKRPKMPESLGIIFYHVAAPTKPNHDEELVRLMVRDTFHRFFQGTDRTFFYAQNARKLLENSDCRLKDEKRRWILLELAEMMIHDLEHSYQVQENLTLNSLDIAHWVTCQIAQQDRILACRLMRTCGEKIESIEADAFFWRLMQTDQTDDWEVRALAEGIAKREKVKTLVSKDLMEKGRGPKLGADLKTDIRMLCNKMADDEIKIISEEAMSKLEELRVVIGTVEADLWFKTSFPWLKLE